MTWGPTNSGCRFGSCLFVGMCAPAPRCFRLPQPRRSDHIYTIHPSILSSGMADHKSITVVTLPGLPYHTFTQRDGDGSSPNIVVPSTSYDTAKDASGENGLPTSTSDQPQIMAASEAQAPAQPLVSCCCCYCCVVLAIMGIVIWEIVTHAHSSSSSGGGNAPGGGGGGP